jgi:hypothetical protein
MRTLASSFSVLAAVALAGCKPDLGAPTSLVVGPRILAVRGTPPEAPPGANVMYDALAVTVGGRIVDPALTWSQCHDPKPPAEANAVSTACLDEPDDAGPAAVFAAAMPGPACMQYGPLPPTLPPLSPEDMAAGKTQPPPLRPRDPDITGGFYQPVRVRLQSAEGGKTETTFAFERIKCNLANVPIDATRTFNATYTVNNNPLIAALTMDPDGNATSLYARPADGAPPDVAVPAPVTAGAAVTLEVTWPPETAETYPAWDIVSRTLQTRREALRASWFATAGEFTHDRTGRGEDDPQSTTRNVWTAPTFPGVVHLWIVLRDSRGGLDYAEAGVDVTP